MGKPSPVPIRTDRGVNLSSPNSVLEAGELEIARNCHYPPETTTLTKIAGRSNFGALGTSRSVTGLVWSRFRSGSAFLVVSDGTSILTAPSGFTGSWTSRASGLTGGGYMDGAYFAAKDRLYLFDGVNRGRVFDGSTIRTVGLLTPTSSGAISYLSNGGSRYSAGATFYYTHTEYDSTNDRESPAPAAVKNSASADSGTFRYVFPTSAANGSDFDKYRLYRTQNGGKVFYRIAEIPKANLRYYDGDDTEALGNSAESETVYGTDFKTVSDQFLSTLPTLNMVGEPLIGNYITVNGAPPIGSIVLEFDGSLCVAGVPGFPHDLYFSEAGYPENFSSASFVRVPAARGEQITGGIKANDRLLLFTRNSIWRLNYLPRVTDPGFGLGQSRLEEVGKDEPGCVAKRSAVNFGVGQPNNRAFYLSERGPMMTDGYSTLALNQDLDWSSRLVNTGAMERAVAVNFPKYQQIWLCVPSKESSLPDHAWIYHYHPMHQKRPPVGKWTGPVSVRCLSAAVAYDLGTESRLFVGDTDSSGKVYLCDTGTADDQNADDSTGKIDWEWATGHQGLGAESINKRVQRVFLNVAGTESFDAAMKCSMSKSDAEFPVALANVTSASGSKPIAVGDSQIEPVRTRTYRGGVWQAGTHVRFRVRELAKAERAVATFEAEVQSYGGA